MLNILIIDDTRSIHAYLGALVAKASNIKTTSAYNGAEGLKVLENHADFDLILLDWEMPVLNGPETLARLTQCYANIPVIMVTTKNSPEDILYMLEHGAVDYIMKPFTADILFEKIEAVTGKGVARAA